MHQNTGNYSILQRAWQVPARPWRVWTSVLRESSLGMPMWHDCASHYDRAAELYRQRPTSQARSLFPWPTVGAGRVRTPSPDFPENRRRLCERVAPDQSKETQKKQGNKDGDSRRQRRRIPLSNAPKIPKRETPENQKIPKRTLKWATKWPARI